MKNFVKHTLAIAICAVALLSSCIKEESYVTQDVILDVQLTRAGTDSAQQGDQIEDIMLWAFELNGAGEVINNNPVGWRQFKAPNPTFTQLSLHLPVKMCGKDGAKYRIIAVLNTQKFTNANGNAISFNGSTTYEALTTGKFVSKAVMDSAIEENKPGTPAVMPVSHWADVEVAQSNVHDNNACASVSIDVFRTVAKTQFFMAGKAGAEFDLEVTELSLHCGAMPTDGLILSSLAPDALKDKNTTPDWFGDSEPTIVGSTATDADKTISLVPAGATVAVDGEDYFHENRPVIADNETAANHYKLIGSHFLYENPEGFTFTDNATSAPEGDGYYYKVVYEADNQEYTRYVALPSILRNHDYQIHALVEGGSGELSFEVVVNEWAVEEEIIDYTNIVTVTEEGRMKWTQLPDERQVPDGYTHDKDGYILDSAEKNVGVVPVPVTADSDGVIYMTEYGDAYATCTFALSTPVGGTWYAVLETVSGDVDAFEIVEANSGAADNVVADGLKTTHTGTTASGPISPVDVTTGNTVTGLVTLKFKTKADNETLTPNQAVLKITAKGFWGGNERVYEVVNLTGLTDANGKDVNYSLRQPVKAL